MPEKIPEKKTFGQEIIDAQKMSGYQGIDETWQAYQPKFIDTIRQAVSKGEEAGLKSFFIWIIIRKPPEAPNIMQICPYIRQTAPKPWQAWDHFCYAFNKRDGLKLLWNVPRPEILKYVISNPNGFDPSYVNMLRDVKKQIDQHISRVDLREQIAKLNHPVKKFNQMKAF